MSEAQSSRISRNTDFSIARILAMDARSERATETVALDSIANFQEANRERDARQEQERLEEAVPRNQREKREEYFDSCNRFPNERTCSRSSVVTSQRRDYDNARTSDLTWLQYTRYKPPRLPRRSFVERRRQRRAGEHPRIPFSSTQLQVLEDRYKRGAYLSRNDVIEMSAMLRLPQNKVKIWFQNRRARQRRESLNSTMPTR